MAVQGFDILDAAAAAFTKTCRAGRECPLLGGAAPVERPGNCPVEGGCDRASLAAWTTAFQSAAVEVKAGAAAPVAGTGETAGTDGDAMLMNIREAAGMLGISVSSIQRLVRAGRFPQPVRMLGSLVRWRRTDLAPFAAGRAVPAAVSSAPQEQEEGRPRRGGRPKGSKNRRTLEKEAWRSAYGPGRAGNQ